MQRLNDNAGDILFRRIYSTLRIGLDIALPRGLGAVEYAALFILAAALWSLVLFFALSSLS